MALPLYVHRRSHMGDVEVEQSTMASSIFEACMCIYVQLAVLESLNFSIYYQSTWSRYCLNGQFPFHINLNLRGNQSWVCGKGIPCVGACWLETLHWPSFDNMSTFDNAKTLALVHH
jgi:hypothetical protein